MALQTGGDNETVIIVGAGWSGLGAAELRKAGKPFVLLEARDRVGGRSFTSNVFGGYFDMGSSWVHGTEDNPIMNFVNEFSLKYVGGF